MAMNVFEEHQSVDRFLALIYQISHLELGIHRFLDSPEMTSFVDLLNKTSQISANFQTAVPPHETVMSVAA